MTIIKNEYASAKLTKLNHIDLTDQQNESIRYLSHLYVPKEHRQKGYASDLLNTITKQADEAGITLLLEPKAYDDGTYTDLKPFYVKHGFKVIQKTPTLMMRAATKS